MRSKTLLGGVALGATLLCSGFVVADPAAAKWRYSWKEAKRLTANVVYDEYGIDVRPSEVGCLPRPRKRRVTTRTKAHRWDCTWVHTVERDGDSERVCSGEIRITGSDDGEYDFYYTITGRKTCEWL